MMKISNRFLLILTVILLLTITVSGCNFPNYVDESEFVDKTYIYEKDGFGGPFAISIYSDGTFSYYVGFLSSYIGAGEWTYFNGILTLIDQTGLEIKNKFAVEEDTLIFIEKGSDGFMHLNVNNGEKFHAVDKSEPLTWT